MKTFLNYFRNVIFIFGVCFALVGCPGQRGPNGVVTPVQEPEGFGGLSDKTVQLMQKVSDGVAVTGEYIEQKDLVAAKTANDLTASLLIPSDPKGMDWFRTLCLPSADIHTIAKAKSDNAKLLEEVKTLRIKVANGISPEEAARRVTEGQKVTAQIESDKWRDRIIYGIGALITVAAFAIIGLGVYLMPSTNGRKLTMVGGALLPCSGFVFAVPGFLESKAFQRSQDFVAYGSAALIFSLLAYGAWQAHKWIADAKLTKAA